MYGRNGNNIVMKNAEKNLLKCISTIYFLIRIIVTI